MDQEEFSSLNDSDALDKVAIFVDRAGDTGDGKLNDNALTLIDALAERTTLTGEHRILLHYFRANAFENRLSIAGESQAWAWEIPSFEKILFELRRAVRADGFREVDPLRQCQILTNLANKLNTVGRPVEALAVWDRAIAINPRFGTALSNRGMSLAFYADAHYDQGAGGLMLLSAHDSLRAAADKSAMYDSPESARYSQLFTSRAEHIANAIDLDIARENLFQDFSLGASRPEKAYRAWALQNRLFLNPLNDVGEYPIAARDVLHLPSLTTEVASGPPAVFGFYNQMKQEYVSARWLYFEGLTEHHSHFSDHSTHLYDTLSIPAYSLTVEKTKLAFRMAYSLFDKIAFFINHYFEVGLPEHKVNFRSVWYLLKGEPKPLSPVFKDRQNWPLRGLFWLSRDIHEAAFQEVAEPGAEGLATLRNHLEHKYCQVHEDLGIQYSQFANSPTGLDLAFRIGRDELEAKTLHVLQKARSALIYLSLSVHREEAVRNAKHDRSGVAQMPLRKWSQRRR